MEIDSGQFIILPNDYTEFDRFSLIIVMAIFLILLNFVI